MPARKMEDKRVLVTGAGTGIGKGVALEFAREGADVALHFSHSPAGAASVVEEVRRGGGKAELFHADFNDVDQAKRLVDDAIRFLGAGIDVLVNNAGIRAVRHALPRQRARHVLRDAGGSSGNGSATREGGGDQSIFRTRLCWNDRAHGLRRYQGRDCGVHPCSGARACLKSIRVNAIAPGWILVENHYQVMPHLDPQAAAKTIPAGIVGDPVDVARLVMFLASDEALIVGETFVIDGGQTTILPLTGDFIQPRNFQFGRGYLPGL